MVEEIRKTNAASLREAITLYFEEEIRSGRLKPGDVLPSSRELAERLDTSFPNVHKALVPLAKAGLILRDRRKGTVVLEPRQELRSVAIYVYRENLDDMPQFQRILIDRITERLRERGIAARLLLDNGLLFGMEQLEKWVKNREVQGVIVPIGSRNAILPRTRLQALPAAVAAGDTVGLDMAGWLKTAIGAAAGAGCRRPAVITAAERYRMAGGKWRETEFFRTLHAELKHHQLECPEQLIRCIHDESQYFRAGEQMTAFGFRQCNELLALPEAERPDALLVFPDQLITGIMLSVMRNPVPVPAALKLFVHRNWEIEEPLFLPATMIGISIDECAGKLIDNLLAACHRRPVRQYRIQPEVRTAC